MYTTITLSTLLFLDLAEYRCRWGRLKGPQAARGQPARDTVRVRVITVRVRVRVRVRVTVTVTVSVRVEIRVRVSVRAYTRY